MSTSGERVSGRRKGKCRSSEIFGESEAKQGVQHGPGGMRKAERCGMGQRALPSWRYPLWFKDLGHDSEPDGKPLRELDKKIPMT